jgi:hypothetical protein
MRLVTFVSLKVGHCNNMQYLITCLKYGHFVTFIPPDLYSASNGLAQTLWSIGLTHLMYIIRSNLLLCF